MRLDAHVVADFCHQLGRQISQLIMAQGYLICGTWNQKLSIYTV